MDALSLQMEMRDFHLTAEGIPKYINMLEDAHRTALRMDASNTITDKSVLTIAANAMLITQQFLRTNDEWEDLPKPDKRWDKWKTMYKAAQGKEWIRKQAIGEANAVPQAIFVFLLYFYFTLNFRTHHPTHLKSYCKGVL